MNVKFQHIKDRRFLPNLMKCTYKQTKQKSLHLASITPNSERINALLHHEQARQRCLLSLLPLNALWKFYSEKKNVIQVGNKEANWFYSQKTRLSRDNWIESSKKLLEWVNLSKLHDIRWIYKHQSYFYMLAINNQKFNLFEKYHSQQHENIWNT